MFALVLNSIFDSRLSNSTSIHQFCDSASTWLRLRSFGIRLDDESLVGTQLRRNLTLRKIPFLTNFHYIIYEQSPYKTSCGEYTGLQNYVAVRKVKTISLRTKS